MSGGAMTAPAAVPALMTPIGERSLARGEPLRDSFGSRGNPPPSPTPSRKRLTSSELKPLAKPWLADASDHEIMMTSSPRRVPSRSTRAPPPAYITA